MLRSLRLAPWSLSVLVALSPAAIAQSWPTDFVTEELGDGWVQPTCLCYPDHDTDFDLLVAEKGGVVWNVRGGIKRFTPVIDLSLEVLNNGDRGLLGLAADPEWHDNGYIYLLYVVDPDGDGNDAEQESFGRLTRYTTTLDEYGDLVADPNSRLVLIGATWPEGIPSLHWSHAIGSLRFGTDGSLFVSSGDGAHYDLTDTGGFDPNGFGPGKFPPSEDIGSYRSLSLTSLAGKILRIDPATGLGLPDNPYYTGNPADHASMVWVLGLRNPFRIALRPNTGTPGRLYISDVGWNDYEELNQAYGGENFGWPCMEGPQTQSSYDSADPYGACNDPTIFTKPLWSYHHWRPGGPGFTGQCVAGAQVYEGSEYPQKYVGRLFFCEYASNWIRTVRFVNGKATDVEVFGNAVGNPIDLVANPLNGDL